MPASGPLTIWKQDLVSKGREWLVGRRGFQTRVFSDSELKGEDSKDMLRDQLGNWLARAEILQELEENNVRKVSRGPATHATGATWAALEPQHRMNCVPELDDKECKLFYNQDREETARRKGRGGWGRGQWWVNQKRQTEQSSNYTPLTKNIKPGSPATFQLSLVFTMHGCGRGSLCFWGELSTPGPVAQNTGVVLIATTVIFQPPSFSQLTCPSSIHLSPKTPVAERGVKGKKPASGPNSGTEHPSETKDSRYARDFHRHPSWDTTIPGTSTYHPLAMWASFFKNWSISKASLGKLSHFTSGLEN